jgi:hypothetical protein
VADGRVEGAEVIEEVFRRTAFRKDRPHRFMLGIRHLLHEGEEEFVLAGEIGIERAARKPCCFGNFFNGSGGIADPCDHLGSRLEQALAGRFA